MQLEVGAILEGKVTGITNFGVFVELEENKTGMVHISEVAPTYVSQIRDHVQENQIVKVKVLNIGEDGKISLSIKRAMDPQPQQRSPQQRPPQRRPEQSSGRSDGNFASRRNEPMSFEDMLSKFKQSSDEKMMDLKKKGNDRRASAKRGGPR